MRYLLPAIFLVTGAAFAGEAPTLNIDKSRVTASGISAGAHMAHQLHIAYSDLFSGVGIVSGGPFGCADNSLLTAMKRCMENTDQPLPVVELAAEIRADAEAGKLYWADTGGRGSGPFTTSARRIARCNLDGTEFENLSIPAANSEPWDLALDIRSPSYADWRMRFFSVTTPQAGPTDDAGRLMEAPETGEHAADRKGDQNDLLCVYSGFYARLRIVTVGFDFKTRPRFME